MNNEAVPLSSLRIAILADHSLRLVARQSRRSHAASVTVSAWSARYWVSDCRPEWLYLCSVAEPAERVDHGRLDRADRHAAFVGNGP
jgi:hypothetical protein